jgi:RND superfamily putative drug exporter
VKPTRDSARAERGKPRHSLLLRHPKIVLALAAVILAALGIVGTGVEGRLDPTTLTIPGTESARGDTMLREHFGESAPFAIYLRGPAAELDRQGPQLIRALRRDPKVTTLSPWDRGAVGRLRPVPTKALILVDFHVDSRTAVNVTVPHLEEVLEHEVHAPVIATQSGFASLSKALQDESISASERGEVIALPFLLIILLLVFRSPIAAGIPLIFGAITVVASRGILYYFTSWFDIDAFALTVTTMMGLALGVDYSLLMVSRFREELAKGTDPLDAAALTRHTAGRTTVFAGSTLLLSMLVSLFILPGSLLASLAGTVMMVVILSVTVATIVGPAVLVLVGPNVDRWRVGKPAPEGSTSRLMTIVGAALRRPLLVAGVIGLVLLVLAGPAIGLKTGPPSPEQLDRNAPARKDAELIDRAIGPGWDAPFQIVAVSDHGPITDAKSLGALDTFQEELADQNGIQAVVGPQKATKRVAPLRNLGNRVLSTEGNIGPVKELSKLGRNLKVAAGGVGQLRAGIAEASDGAGLLATGAGNAEEGAEMIANGLSRAHAGSEEAVTALGKLEQGAKKLHAADEKAALGALQIKLVLRDSMTPNLRNNGLHRTQTAQKDLNEQANVKVPAMIPPATVAAEKLKQAYEGLQSMGVGKTDPAYAGVLDAVRQADAAVSGTDPGTNAPYAAGYAGLPTELTALQTALGKDHEQVAQATAGINSTMHELSKLTKGSERLTDGLNKIEGGAKELTEGTEELHTEAKKLEEGLGKLGAGTVELVGGIGKLGGGAEALATGLTEGAAESLPLETGLEKASVQVLEGHRKIRRQAGKVKESTPGLFNSGYFVLSALDGTPTKTREAITETIDLGNGGQGASILAISKYPFNSDGSIRLNKELNGRAKELEGEGDIKAGVAGSAAQLNDFSRVTRERIPWVVVAITLATFLMLVIVLRALLLAAIATALNLVTVGVAFGVLTALSHLPDSVPLGGHHYVEAVGATMIFGLVFGLSIDYAVFLLSRMREHYDKHGDNAAAIHFGLSKTAGVITGAALIMMAVFIAFAATPIATVSQLGVGLTVAVLLDATVVRIVLLPALMLLVGDRVWWLPGPLSRAMPKFNV